MKQQHRFTVALLVIAGAAWIATSRLVAAPTIAQIYPPNNAPGGQIVIAVLADGYTSAEQAAFNSDASNLFISDLLLDSYYKGQKAKFTIKTVFEPQVGSVSTYGFAPTSTGNCEVDGNAGTASAVWNAAAPVTPTFIVVIGNHTATSGCSKDNWTYVYAGAFQERVLEHELGHQIAVLFDEYVTRAGPYPNPPTNSLNCSTQVSSPWWTSLSLSGVTNSPGCDLYPSGVVRPFAHCLMNDYADFCAVCRRMMDAALQPIPVLNPSSPTDLRIIKARFQQPAAPRPQVPANRSVQVLLRVDKAAGTASVEAIHELTGPVVLRQRRFGDYMYAISDGEKTVATGMLTGRPFEIRGYEGRGPHTTQPVETATVVVTIPFVTKETLRTGSLAVSVYKIDPRAEQTRDVNVEEFTRLQRIGQVTAIARLSNADLKKALETR